MAGSADVGTGSAQLTQRVPAVIVVGLCEIGWPRTRIRWSGAGRTETVVSTGTGSRNMPEHKYVVGDVVWLVETGPPDYEETCPRQLAEILVCEEIKMAHPFVDGVLRKDLWKPDEMYVVRVEPMDSEDDGIREVQVEIIQRLATEEEAVPLSMVKMTSEARAYLRQAGQYIGYEEPTP